jgi:poly(A)-specific ribonuclease
VEAKVTETMFDKANPFQRKLIYELIEREFFNKVSTKVQTIENNRKALIVESKRSDEEELQIEKNRQLEDEKYVAGYVGLRLILKEISASKKLVVGHNCLLDLMYLQTQCIEELPTDYEEFKKLTHRTFPNIIDTKFIGASEKFKDMFSSTVLNQLYEQLLKPPFHKVDFEFENPYSAYSLDKPKEHEAGYDSFLTGYCFLAILKYLKVSLSDDFQPNKCKELNPFLNRIALVRIQQPFIYVTGKEPTFSRDHVFFVKFPVTWQTSDVQDHFKNYGPVHCSWVNSSSAFVSLYNRENASCVLKTIARPVEFEIQTFADFQRAEQRNSSRKRKKENSESSEHSDSPKNGSKSDGQPKKKKRGGKKVFAESDQW